MLPSGVPNIITSSPSGGRFDFDDGGSYCGGWQDSKAHGHGVCTGPKNVGQYSGSWNFGFEMSGVYKWTNGAVYEGRWQNGKRHGVGVEYNGKWIYKGEWSQGSKGRYGVKASSNSAVKYEGTWANGLQDGYGSETYSDGGYYQGQMCRGLRHGYGVRKSAPYGDSQLNNPNKNGPITGGPSSKLLHSNSVQSTSGSADLSAINLTSTNTDDDDDDASPKPEDGFKPNIDRTLVSKNGFVLVAKPLDVPMPAPSSTKTSALLGDSTSKSRRNSLTNKLSSRIPLNLSHQHNQSSTSSPASLLRRGLRGLKKQKSTSDLMDSAGLSINQNHSFARGGPKSSQNDDGGGSTAIIPFTLSPEELDITDPTTVETYTGEWKHDNRCGYGVCERSDGLKYEGQWHNDMKYGYGVTTFKDGTKEEGKYKNNILVVDSRAKRFFNLGGTNIKQRVEDAVKGSHQAQQMALKKAEIADTRAATARDKADQAMTAALEADRDSQIAYSVAYQYNQENTQKQQQQLFGIGNTSGAPPMMGTNFTYGMMLDDRLNQGAGMSYQQQQQQYNDGGSHPTNNFNMSTSALQQRRTSANQLNQQHQMGNIPQTFNQQHHFGQQNEQQDDQQRNYMGANQQRQFLNHPVEPFNGRRGSFRAGSQPPLSGGYQAPGARPTHHMGQNIVPKRQASVGPFGDLFDHYRSPGGGSATGSLSNFRMGPTSAAARRQMMFGKQTSLDYNQLSTGPQRHSNPGNNQAQMRRRAGEAMGRSQARRMRMSSSMDQDDGTNEQTIQDHQKGTDNQDQSSLQQRFKHLVTSGEELEKQRIQQQTDLDSATILSHTPAGSSIALNSHSPTAISASVEKTPSPLNPQFEGQTLINHNIQIHQQKQLDQQQQRQGRNYNFDAQTQQQQQRDAQSLADEQLFSNHSRRLPYDSYYSDYGQIYYDNENVDDVLISKNEYKNYDFTISSEPRPAQRCMRRTASLSRTSHKSYNTRSHTLQLHDDNSHHRSQTPAGNHSRSDLLLETNFPIRQRSASPAISVLGAASSAANWLAATGNMGPSGSPVPSVATTMRHEMRNHMGAMDDPNQQQSMMYTTTSHLTLDSLSSNASALNRKPSLQVRYDPLQLGGLMTRAEVAALSHAQREQKRIEVEMAEKRAKRPLLHLCLGLKEFIFRHQLILSVLFMNLLMMKMFADLIV